MPIDNYPTLDELRLEYEKRQEEMSRFHKHHCPVCGVLITNQAMGRKSHMAMHKRQKKQEKVA
jgi:hypothetical protein